MRTLVEVGGNGLIAVWRPVETRCDHLMLAQASLVRAGGQVTDYFLIVRTDERGLTDLMVVFDAHDRTGAQSELDRLHAPSRHLVAGGNRASAVWDRFAQAVVESRLADAWILLAPDMVRDDNRTGFSMPRANRDQYIASIELLADGGIDLPRELIATRGERLALFELAMTRPTGDSTTVLHINEVDNAGRITRAVVIDPDDLDSAARELDRLHDEQRASSDPAERAGGAVANRCSNVWVSIAPAVNANDWETAEYLLSDAFRFEVHRRTVSGVGGGKAEFRAQANSWSDVGMITELTPIAVRGEHLALFSVQQHGSEGFGVRMCCVTEVNDSGVADYLAVWDEDDLQLAHDELNRRWLGTLDSSLRAAAELTIGFMDAIVHADLARLDVDVAAGFESNDHRPAGLGDRNRATFMAMVAQRPTTVGDGVVIISEFFRCDPEWVIVSIEGRTRPPSGGGYVSEKQVTACQLDGHQLLRADIYPLERPGQALAAAEDALKNR